MYTSQNVKYHLFSSQSREFTSKFNLLTERCLSKFNYSLYQNALANNGLQAAFPINFELLLCSVSLPNSCMLIPTLY